MRRTRLNTRQALLRLSAFFLLLCGALILVDRAINSGLRHVRTSGFGVTNRIIAGTINSEILISGSSRALTHYDPRVIQTITGRTAFNIGLNGSQTDMQLARLKVYLKHNEKPKLLIQNLDLYSFVTSHEIYDPAQYIPYLNEDAIYLGVRGVYADAWKWKYFPLYGYAVLDMRLNWVAGLLALVGVQPTEDHFSGYQPRHTSWTGDFEKYRDQNPHGISIEVESQGVGDFEELLALCAQEGIPVLLVYSPEYYEMQVIERNRKEILAKAKGIADQFHVSLLDYSQSPICRDRKNFYNSQHLNADGAAAFSEDLAQQLLRAQISRKVVNTSKFHPARETNRFASRVDCR
jgi:hypothetical protein